MSDAHFALRAPPAAVPTKRLVWSDYMLLAGLWLALFITADPLDLGFERPANTKHMPLMLATAGLLIAFVGRALDPPRREPGVASWPLIRATWPLALLGVWALAGGIEARMVDHIQDTFLTTGLYMIATLVVAQSVMLSAAHERLIAVICKSLVFVCAFMIVRMVVLQEWTGGMYHELEFLVVPVAVFYALKPSTHPTRDRLLMLFFLLGGIVFMKNTGFIVLIITLSYLLLVEWRFHLRNTERFYRHVVAAAVLIAAGIVGAAVFGNLASEVTMPSGNPGYRVRTYDRAIARFFDSPVWGTLFAARSTARFTAFEIDVAGGQLPTHSDTLDLAANGGVIALGLLAWAYLRIARLARRTLMRARARTETDAAAHMFACMSIAGIAVYAFNPIMLQPDKALLLWGALGMLVGCCLHRNASLPETEGDRP